MGGKKQTTGETNPHNVLRFWVTVKAHDDWIMGWLFTSNDLKMKNAPDYAAVGHVQMANVPSVMFLAA